MSREIKFRAWIKSLNIMAEVLTIDFEAEQVLLKGYKRDTWATFNQVILTQYTGLKDKNDVEIYEGDIVKRTHLFNGGYGETHTGEVVYDKEYARYVISRPQKHIKPKTEDLRHTLSDRSTYEVIGNIYEHQHLLKEGESSL